MSSSWTALQDEEAQEAIQHEYERIERVINALPEDITTRTLTSMLVSILGCYGFEGTNAGHYLRHVADLTDQVNAAQITDEALERLRNRTLN